MADRGPREATKDLATAIYAGDRAAAAATAAQVVAAGLPVRGLVDRYLAPILRTTGEEWLDAKVSAGAEHRRTAAAERALSAAADLSIPSRFPQGVVVVGGVEGDQHTLPPRMLAEVLQEEGWEVVLLGTSLPASEVLALARAADAETVLLCCSVVSAVPALVETVAVLRDEGLTVLVGGAALGADASIAQAAGAQGWAADAEGALRLLRQPAPAVPVSAAFHRLPAHRRAIAALTQLEPELVGCPDQIPLVGSACVEHVKVGAIGLLLDAPTIVTSHREWTLRYLSARGVERDVWERTYARALAVLAPSGSLSDLVSWLEALDRAGGGATWAG